MKAYSEKEYPKQDITEKIIQAAFGVHNRLGPGFVEKVYENALAKELSAMGIVVEQQKELKVLYGGARVGSFSADLLVDQSVIVEMKAVRVLQESYGEKLIHYLKSSNLPVGLILNFGTSSVQIRRKVNSNK